MVDVNVDFVLENDEPINAEFIVEPDVTYTADIMLSAATSFHNELSNRDLPNQHPMGAITGLGEALEAKVDKTDEISKVYGTDEDGDQTTYDVNSFGQVDDVQVGGVSVVTDKIAELGTMAGESATDYSTTAVANTLYADISYEETIDNHIADKNNPHAVTKAQVGLGNCDNTSDLDKPISTAVQTALDGKQATISDLSTIRENATHGESAYNTISGYGDVVTHNASEFATSAQGALADTALQPNDNISELNNDVGYITSASIPTNYVTTDTAQTIGVQKAFSQPLVVADNNGLATGTILSNKKMLQKNSNGIEVGNSTEDILLVGKSATTNPKYNGNDLALKSDIPTNYVTTDTAQTITGTKTFHNCAIESDNFITLTSSNAYIRYSGSGVVRSLLRRNSSGTVEVGSSNDTVKIQGSATRPAYNSSDLALYSDVTSGDSALQSQINDLKSRGHFLALWNCATGLAETNPPQSPYTYQAGDFFIVGVVSTANPPVNYMPDGSSYTTGVASTTVESGTVDVDDTYYYDGTTWKLQINTEKTTAFVNIAGDPYDNTNLATALNAKADTSSLATVATTGDYDDLINKPTITTYTAGTGISISSNTISVTSPTLVNGASLPTNNNLAVLGTITDEVAEDYNNCTVIGIGASVNGSDSLAVGKSAYAGVDSVALGDGARAPFEGVAIGCSANASDDWSTAIGWRAEAGERSTAIGYSASAMSDSSLAVSGYASGDVSLAIQGYVTGDYAVAIKGQATANYAIQLGGNGVNSEANSFYVGTSSSDNWKMLDSNGIIPDARISSNIARTSAIPAAQVNSDWNANSGVAEILNKPTLATVATSGLYSDLSGTPTVDGVTIDTNSDDELEAIGVIEKNAGGVKYDWIGTLAEYNTQAVGTNHPDWVCYITDDSSSTDIVSAIVGAVYPVGSIYIGTMSTCPMASLISGSTWVLVSSGKVLQGADSGHTAGTSISAGLPNITGSFDISDNVAVNGSSYQKLSTMSGAFTKSSNTRNTVALNASTYTVVSDTYYGTGNFSASNSNSIYGNSTTVQPPAYVVNIWERTA